MCGSLEVRQFVPASRAEVFRAWSDLGIARKWSCPEGLTVSHFDADLRPGGRYRLTMKGEGVEISAYGIYREIVPAQRLLYTWIWDTPDTEENLVQVEFKDQGVGTEIVLRVSGFSVPEEIEPNRQGWASSLGRLAACFAGGKLERKSSFVK